VATFAAPFSAMPRTKAFDEQQVLEKAVDLFWRKGYHATSMQDLVDNLGINRASLYGTYGDKKQLFERALSCYQTGNTTFIKSFLSAQPDVKTGIQQLFNYVIEQATSNGERRGCFVVNTTTEMATKDAQIAATLRENQLAFEATLHEYLRTGQQEGQLSKKLNLHHISGLLYTLFVGIQVVSKTEPDPNKLNSIIGTALAALDL
jgi:TetR/AcrR family transcriptional repressor of nem operon